MSSADVFLHAVEMMFNNSTSVIRGTYCCYRYQIGRIAPGRIAIGERPAAAAE
jgi:hypothetical protein